MEKIKTRIKCGLEKRNMLQSELCGMTGIPKSAMSQYVSGKFEPKQTRIYLIAKALNVSEAWLMGADVPMERTSTENHHAELSDDDIKFALYGSNDISDVDYEVVKAVVKQQLEQKRKNEE